VRRPAPWRGLTGPSEGPDHGGVIRQRALVALLLAAALLAPPPPARAAELTGFLSGGSPGEVWSTGYGGMLTITLFNLVSGEIEGAWQGGAVPSTSLASLSAKAYLGPSFGRVVPYGGIGVGVYRESLPADSDTGTLGLVFLGVKLKFPLGLVIRGEFQWVDLPTPAPVQLDHRYVFGLGLSF
jgi:hypothetical protein